jgi:xanthine dehydrogenase accessory factor
MKQAEFARTMNDLVLKGASFAVATVVKAEGTSLAKPGLKVIFSSDGEVLCGSLGGALPESAITDAARQTMRKGIPKLFKVFFDSAGITAGASAKGKSEDEIHVKTNSHGGLEIYIEPYLPPRRLILFGQGGKDDVEDALVRMGKALEFEVVVIDHSPILSEKPDRLVREEDFNIDSLRFTGSDSVVVLTKGGRDVEILEALSKFSPKYVGLLASVQRVKEDIDKLREIGLKENFISSLKAPVGADIGAVTPGEIALSIMAEVVASMHGKNLPRKPSPGGGESPNTGSRAS